MVINDKEKGKVVTEEQDFVYQEVCHLGDKYADDIRDLFVEYEGVIAKSSDHIHSSKVETKRKFKLPTNDPIFQKK